MLRQNHQDLEGNDRYEGFCVDMLKELADILKFKYRIRLVGDRLYGVPGANGTWTGMVGELISRVCKYIHEQAAAIIDYQVILKDGNTPDLKYFLKALTRKSV